MSERHYPLANLFLPSDIVSMMNEIFPWQPLNREQMGRLKYECNKLIDCYIDSSNDEAKSTNFEEEVITKFLLGHFYVNAMISKTA